MRLHDILALTSLDHNGGGPYYDGNPSMMEILLELRERRYESWHKPRLAVSCLLNRALISAPADFSYLSSGAVIFMRV